jgi:hypothetical protein
MALNILVSYRPGVVRPRGLVWPGRLAAALIQRTDAGLFFGPTIAGVLIDATAPRSDS